MHIRTWKKHLLWIIPLLIIDFFVFKALLGGRSEPIQDEPQAIDIAPDILQEKEEKRPSVWVFLTYPTDQTHLDQTNNISVYQPTASGRAQSALYGSVRTVKRGKRFQSSFHEGIDIAALTRDRRNRPQDSIYAIAEGNVVYINKIGGNSNYGKYVIIEHPDEMGSVYSLYAHLADIDNAISRGSSVKPKDHLGTMGNTSSSGIPMIRGHLHLETGLMLNERFDQWFKKKKLKPWHSRYHGWNFIGINPLRLYDMRTTNNDFSFQDVLNQIPVAYTCLVKTKKLPDYFKRYPSLWTGATFDGQTMVLSCSENGLILNGRNATQDEQAQLKSKKNKILTVDDDVLGRNGAHLITKRSGTWELGRSGIRWLEIILF